MALRLGETCNTPHLMFLTLTDNIMETEREKEDEELGNPPRRGFKTSLETQAWIRVPPVDKICIHFCPLSSTVRLNPTSSFLLDP